MTDRRYDLHDKIAERDDGWREVHGSDGEYEVSVNGFIRRLFFVNGKARIKYNSPRILKHHINRRTGYAHVTLSVGGKSMPRLVHREALLSISEDTGADFTMSGYASKAHINNDMGMALDDDFNTARDALALPRPGGEE